MVQILEKIFIEVINMGLTASVMIAGVFLVRLLLKKAPKIYSYVLWSIVLFRLLCPVSFETEISLLGALQNETSVDGRMEYIPQDIGYQLQPEVQMPIEAVNEMVNDSLPQGDFGDSVNPLQIWLYFGARVWILGIVVMLAHSGLSLIKLRKQLKLAVCEDKNIYRMPGKNSPFVYGVFKPRIYLPDHLEEAEKEYVLLHEQVHIRRGDHIYRLLAYLAVCVHWFNPLVWAAFFISGRDMEISCDEAVIRKMGSSVKKEYSSSLLNLACGEKIVKGIPVAFGESDTKSRIKHVLNYKKPAKVLSILAVILCVIAAILFIGNPKKNGIIEIEQKETKENRLTDEAIFNLNQYPLTKEMVVEVFEKVDLPGIVLEERYDSAIRTSIDIRDEDNRLIAGIASNGDGEKRGLFVTLVPYLRSGAASTTLPEEKWEDLIKFATLLYGFEDESIVYNDFINHYKDYAIYTECQYDQEPYYKEQYEWIKSYGSVTCQIKSAVATDGTKDIQGICFFNTSEYSTIISELTVKNFLNNQFTSNSERYVNYLESKDDTVYLNRYANKVTENCIQNMKNAGYFTMVDSYAYRADSQVHFINAVLTESEETKKDKNNCKYLYTATLNCEKDGEIKEFTVQGSICVVNSLNGWMVYDVLLSDKAALEIYITGENDWNLELADKQVQSHSTENHQDLTEQEMLEIFRTEYGWTDLANQQLFWDETTGRAVINYYFEALADEWQMESAREYGLKTFVFKKQNGLGNSHTYQLWAATQEITEVVIQVFCNGNLVYQDIYGGIEDGIIHTESHYVK